MQAPADLVARDTELTRLGAVVAAAREGISAALVLRGEPGIGKTALVDAAVRMADGMAVLRARGVEGEARLPYAGLSQLLLPVLDVLAQLPAAERAALEAALAIGSPGEHDAVATGGALLDLLAVAAERRPVLVAVDDLHWFDPASRAVVLAAARRAGAEGVAFVLATRPDGPVPSGVAVHEVPPLPDEAARAMLARVARLGPADARRVLDTAAGNPLALIEIPRLLRGTPGAGSPAGPLPAGATLEAALREPLDDLSPEARRALVVAAVDEAAPRAVLDVALAQAGLEPATLSEAEAAGLIRRADDGVTFRHPLLRSAVYHGATGPVRRAAHAALASAWPAGSARWSWHAAGAALGPDARIAAALEDVAREASARGAHDAAATAWRRSADLSPDSRVRFDRRLAAAGELLRTGSLDEADVVLDAARADPPPAPDWREHEILRGRLSLRRDAPMSARDRLVDAAAQLEDTEPARAAELMMEAAWATMHGGGGPAITELSDRALALLGDEDTLLRMTAVLVRGAGRVGAGDVEAGERDLRDGARRTHELDAMPPNVEGVAQTAHVALWGGLYDVAEEILDWLDRVLRRAGAPAALGMPLAMRSRLALRRGRVAEALAAASEAVELAEETGHSTIRAHALGQLADVEAHLGREEACRRHAAAALSLAHGIRADVTAVYPHVALGVLELGLSRIEAAVEHLRRADDALQRVRLVDPGFLLTRPLLVEALARQGETAEAERLLDGYELTVDATGRQLGRALAARCRGLLAGDDGYEACFARAIALHPAGDRPFELARTQLALGERRRRARRRAAAREPLSAALATFERLGATLWAARARRELELSGTPAGTGAPEASAGTSAIDELTPQELRIALLVGRGLANRQIAGSLFVSTRTVEAHLRQIYRKLDLRSRTELARMIARAAPHLD